MTVQDHLSPEVLQQLADIDSAYASSDVVGADPRRLAFEEILKHVLGNSNVYYTPPEGIRAEMQYPCLVYELDTMQRTSADNLAYTLTPRYQVTFIRKTKADNPVVHKLGALPNSSFSRHFATSGLNHDVFTIYY